MLSLSRMERTFGMLEVHNLILHDAGTVGVQQRVDEIVALILAYLTTTA
jgi:hypothetical protein